MKVIYRSLAREIRDAVTEADKACRRIERVELSLTEVSSLARELMENDIYRCSLPIGIGPGQKVGVICGVDVYRAPDALK